MKSSTLLFGIASVLLPTLGHASIWRVNNAPNNIYDADFQTINAAVQSVEVIAGDTLHIEASEDTYGDASITKRLVLIGTGFKLGANPGNPGLQANSNMSTVNAITLGDLADGSVICGLRFASSGGGLILQAVENITVMRCFFDAYPLAFDGAFSQSNITIKQCYFTGSIYEEDQGTAQSISLITIANNIIGGNILFDDAGDTFSAIVITNNIFTGGNSAFRGTTFQNNVLYNSGTSVSVGTDNSFLNNIAAGTIAWDLADENVNQVVMSNEFIGTGSDDMRFQLQSGSNYDDHATDGGQVGIFGGPYPWKPSGIPNIPTIYDLDVPATVLQGGQVNSTLSTRTND